jgi:hypothetical protein
MTQETFRLIDAVCREGIANDVWGVAEDFNTSVYLGTTEDIDLLGKYLYVYRDVNEHFCFIGKHKPIYSLYHNEDTIVELYKLN